MIPAILYVSPEEADAYFSGRPGLSGWPELGLPEKTAILARAMSMLDQQMTWKGEPAAEGQALRWPRKNVKDADGRPVPDSAIPPEIKAAVCEQALSLCRNARKLERSGLKSASLGGMSLNFSDESASSRICPEALETCGVLGRLRTSRKNGSLMRG